MAVAERITHQAVDRPALRDKLDGLLDVPLALLVAPAGAGKTVLLRQWSEHQHDLAIIWLDLNSHDNDPARLARKLTKGLARAGTDVGALSATVPMVRGGLGTRFLEEFAVLLDDLQPTVFVLDDFHRLTNDVLLDDIVAVVDQLPPQVHVAIATRTDLTLRWAPRRLRGALIEIRNADLAFDIEHSAQLLERISRHRLTMENVARLVDRTEGWAAGLQMAGLMLRAREDADEFVAGFGGTDRLVADYLGEAVLRAQAPAVRAGLLEASVLDEMSGDLLTAMTGSTDAQLFLELLERESMFVVGLDDRRHWFRFHSLFQDLLRYRLRAAAPDVEKALLRRAANWYADQGDSDHAIEYLLRAQSWTEAYDLIRSRGHEVYEHGEMLTMISWIEQMPVSTDPAPVERTLLLGLLHALAGQMVIAGDLLSDVLNSEAASDADRLICLAFLSARAQWTPHAETTITLAVRALDLLDRLPRIVTPNWFGLTTRSSLKTLTLFSGGRSLFLQGDFDESRRWLRAALASEGASYSLWRISALGSLALLEAWCGRTRVARDLADEALRIADEAHLAEHPGTADAHLAKAFTAAEGANVAEAASALHQGISLAASNGRTQLLWVGHLLETELLGPIDTISSPRPQPTAPPPPIVRDRLLAGQLRAWRLGGQAERALADMPRAYGTSHWVHFEKVAAALTLDKARVARDWLASWPALAAGSASTEDLEYLILGAWLSHTEGKVLNAQRELDMALRFAQDNGSVDTFLRAGPEVIRMLQRQPAQRSEFQDRVLERGMSLMATSADANFAGHFTQRELEILACLPGRTTNTELAEQFYVSVNTIKTHMVHIYRKLDVPNRSAAIVRARELGLLR
jgi:LuxR family maltose regulon positive regulatory protein